MLKCERRIFRARRRDREDGPKLRGQHDDRDGRVLLISTAPPTRADRALAVAVVAALFFAMLATIPFASVRVPGTASLIPAYFVAVFLSHIITAVLLLGLYSVQRSFRVLVLAGAYLFAGLMIVPWAVTFPGAFPSFQFETGLQSTATLAALNRLAFPLCILVYALARERPGVPARQSSALSILVLVAGVVAVVAVATGIVLFSDVPLPPFMLDERTVAPLWGFVPPTSLAICALAILALRANFTSVLDLWLIVVLVSLVIEIVLIFYVSGGVRLSLGWWAGRLYGLVAASAVLVVLLSATTALYARLARSVLAERRARDSRLTVMEAVSASIAHEIRQPLASVEISAAAGLRWLRREPPDLGEVEAVLKRIEFVGARTGMVIDTVRSSFKAGGGRRTNVDVNGVIRDTLARCEGEAALGRVAVETALHEPLPPVRIDPLQLQLVLSNLIGNSIDAMREVTGRQRLLTITSQAADGEVVVSLADSGKGLLAAEKEQIFSALFTTKPDGMGIGLMFCRSIIETNGGRIWASDNDPHGAVFHFALAPAGPDGTPQEPGTRRQTLARPD